MLPPGTTLRLPAAGDWTSPRNPSITPLLTLLRPTTPKPKHYSAPSYYTTKASEYYTTTYASPTYYKEVLITRAEIFISFLCVFNLMVISLWLRVTGN
jgi:hypothetical protein